MANSNHIYKSAREVRAAFRAEWKDYLREKPEHENDKPMRREAFSFFVDRLARDGLISDNLAQSVTLEE